MVVNVSEGGVYAFDLQMHPVANLSTYGANGAIAGAAFSPDGSRIYLWQGEQSHVFVLDSTTYQQVGTLEVGSVVEVDSVIAIIEVMKLMNTVRAGVKGVITEILPADEALVEYGEVLMRARTDA